MVPHRVGRVKSQESSLSARAITTAPACFGTSFQ
jgi:hypothetical protein